jgi:hypothetical protein
MSMHITNKSREYYDSIVYLNGTKIVDYEWANDERGEVMVIIPSSTRDKHGSRKQKKELRKGTVKIVTNAGSSRY